MTQPRQHLVDLSVTKIYHCISRCVRQMALLEGSSVHRKRWIEDRLKVLAQNFAISVAEYAIMGNHLHVLVRMAPEQSHTWTDEEVLLRWLRANPQKRVDPSNSEQLRNWLQKETLKPNRVEILRARLTDLGWFMKCLKEPIAKRANLEDGCKGPFWDGRYKSVAVVDDEALVATAVYIALNPLAANVVSSPEKGGYTGLVQRLSFPQETGRLNRLVQMNEKQAQPTSSDKNSSLHSPSKDWLCPLDDRSSDGKSPPGLLKGLTLNGYLKIVDHASRVQRPGKACLPADAPDIFRRLKIDPVVLTKRVSKLLNTSEILGGHFSSSRKRLTEIAEQKGKRRLHNVMPLSASS